MKTLITSIRILLFFTILTGIVYPLFVTGIVQFAFKDKANGSLIVKGNNVIGSKLIGQQFDSTIYFSSRPSAVSYNPLPSGGSNLGITNLKLKRTVEERKLSFIRFNQVDGLTDIPSEMLFASASGLDPHISPKAALLQVDRIAVARKFSSVQRSRLNETIENLTEKPQFYIFGEERINLLMLNIELDKLSAADHIFKIDAFSGKVYTKSNCYKH
ncbi:MAG: potassium-transporting ATPase subunit KdpC [Bacteroidales bacterium]|nr:potassium-transporting ATPase subunit KdpC [Bacteroidales bacterium]